MWINNFFHKLGNFQFHFLGKFIFHLTVVAIGTAKHVTKQAFKWHKPIQIIYPFKSEIKVLTFDNYKFEENPYNDLSIIVIRSETFSFPEKTPTLVDPKDYVLPGVQIGWCGFPGNLPEPVNLCYFSGHVSSIFGDLVFDSAR